MRSVDGYLRRQYLCVLRRCVFFSALSYGWGALAIGSAPVSADSVTPGSIVIDGRTQTTLSVTGVTTDVTTETIRGDNAFNSFRKFNIADGEIVNLFLPDGSSNLLNLVRDERSYFDGILNAYKNGQIGGNIFFLNPHGLVVGESGVLNVGSLTLATPTQGFMDSLIDPSGLIGGNAVQATLNGSVPLTESGLIRVKGSINASSAVNLMAGSIDTAVGSRIIAGPTVSVQFSDLVNIEGLQTPTSVEIEDGVIRIVATTDVDIAGQVVAGGIAGHDAGTIKVEAGSDIKVLSGAKVSANGDGLNSAGGNVVIIAERDSLLEGGASVSANAGLSGDGGFVEFSAKKHVNLSGGLLSAEAVGGLAGTVLIDPEDITWTGSGFDVFSATNYELQADNSITFSDVVISTRSVAAADNNRANIDGAASIGDSGSITLIAPSITLNSGTRLLAHADGGFSAGDITLTATDNPSTPVFGSFDNALANINIDGAVLKGRNINIAATANDKWVWTGNEDIDQVLDFLSGTAFFVDATVSTANASVSLDNGANIEASGNVDIESHSIADASMHLLGSVLGFGYGETDSQARVTVGDATLSAAGSMDLKTTADSSLSVTVTTVNTGALNNLVSTASEYANFAFAVGKATQVSDVTVGDAATVSQASELNIEAIGKKEHSVGASGGSFKDGVASSGIAVLQSDTTFNARLGGNINADEITIKAELAEAETEVSAGAGTGGTPKFSDAITSAKPFDERLIEATSAYVAGSPSPDSRSGASGKLGLAASYAAAENNNTIRAEVANNANINVIGGLQVLAKAEEGVSFASEAKVDKREFAAETPSETGGAATTEEDKKAVAISAAVLNVEMNHHADALIGDGAVIETGEVINVSAESAITPFWSDWVEAVDKVKNMTWDDAGAWYELESAAAGLIEDPVNATTWSKTSVESEKASFAGAVSFFTLDNKATAKIGAAGINVGSANPGEEQDVNVIARASQGILNLSGVPEVEDFFDSSNESGKAGFGGSYVQFDLSGGTDASIAQGATVRADDIAVIAHTSFDQIDAAETVGKAGKVSVNGAFSLLNVDLETIAQVGAGGSMDVDNLLVQAKDDSLIINIGGGVARSESVGIGFSVAINDVERQVLAIVGNRDSEDGAGGTINARGNVLLDAQTSNTVGAFTVAGSGPSANESDAGKTGGDGTKTNSKDSGQKGKSGVGVSASASVNIVHDTTAARMSDLDSVTVSGTSDSSFGVDLDGDGNVSDDEITTLSQGLELSAEDLALIIAGAGSLTVATDKSAGLAGAFTWNQLIKDTRSLLSDIQVAVNNGDLELDADNTGSLWSVSASAAGGDKTGIAGSVSYSTVDNVTEAKIEEANAEADGSVELNAKDDSDIRSIAGAGSYGGKAGLGAGVAISTVGSETLASIDGGNGGSEVSGDTGVSVTATNENDIFSVAAALSASRGVTVSGSVTYNVIDTKTEAASTDSLVTSSNGNVEIKADDTAEILSIAGSAALSAGSASVGIAGAYNEINNESAALVTGGTLNGQSVEVEATENSEISTYAVGGAGGSQNAGAGSLGINTISNNTSASTSGAALIASAGDAVVQATDSSTIESITGAAAIGGSNAIGASGSYNHINGEVTAEISGGSASGANVLVNAERQGNVDVWAISGSGAGTAGIAGSIALNDTGGLTTARVDEGANVSAAGNSIISAQTDDVIISKAGAVGAGGSVGGAGGVALNDIHGATLAEVTGTATQVNGLGNGLAASVDNGVLRAKTNGSTLNTRQQKDDVKGVAVVASSTSMVENYVVNAAGGGSAGVAATVSIALMGGSTTSQVTGGAALNTNIGGVDQEARVAAYHHDNIVSGTGGGAIGGSAGVGGAVDTIDVSRATRVRVENASAQAQQAVTLDAGSSTDITQAVIAVGGGGSVGLAGTGGVILLDGTTEALADNADLTSNGSLQVEASSDSDIEIEAGALAVGGVAGVGITAAVTVEEQNTRAVVSGNSELNANAGTTINAASAFDQTNYAYTAAAAGGTGVAGTANVVVTKGSTEALVGNGVTINSDAGYGGAEQDVNVTASDTITVENRVGSLGIGLGGVGVGAVADVTLIHKGATASVDSGASITADRDIAVSAESLRDVDSVSTAFAGGYTAGIAGAVSVVSVGARSDDDAQDNTIGTVATASDMSSGSATGDQMGDEGAESSARANDARAQIDLSQDLDTAPINSSAAAVVADGATLNSGRHIEVNAHNQTDIDATAVGAAVSGGLSIGGGVAIATVEDRTLASLEANTVAGGDVSVAAVDDQSNQSLLQTWAGGGGLAGLAASFAWHENTSTATALLGGTVNAATGSVTVDAGIDHDLKSEGVAAAAGVVGIGASIAYVIEDSEASAEVLEDAEITAASLDVHGHSQTDTDADVLAAAGGLVSGAGADANTKNLSSAKATIGDNAVIRTTSGLTQVRADVDPLAKSKATGVAVSAGVSIGASLADAVVETEAEASTGSNVDIVANAMTVKAETRLRDKTAESDATAGVGGLLLGASATDANSIVNSSTTAAVGMANDITLTGEFDIDASTDTYANADVTGINIGFLAAGINNAKATTDTETSAFLGSDANVTAAALNILAGGIDESFANAIAGSGGVYSGAASAANTRSDSTTKAYIDNNSTTHNIDVADLAIIADHTSRINSTVDSTNASVLGASGAAAHNRSANTVWAGIGDHVSVDARNVDINAINRTRKAALTGFNVLSASGGLFDAAATHSDTTVNNDTDVVIADQVNINATALGLDNGHISVTAFNDVELYDSGKMDSGGAIALAKAESFIYNDQNDADIAVGSGTLLVSDDNITLESKTNAIADTEVQSKTYGLSGAAQGKTISRIGTSNKIALNGARLESDENIILRAGVNNVIKADAETRLWNKTALPVETDPDADASIIQNNHIAVNAYQPSSGTLSTGDTSDEQIARAAIAAVKDIHLESGEGSHTTRGYGRGTDLYRELIEDAAKLFGSNISLDITGGSTYDNSRSGVDVGGTVFAGTHFHQFLHIDASGNITELSEGMSLPGYRANVDLGRDIEERIDALQALYDEYIDDNPDIANGFQADIDLLNAKRSKLGVGATANFFDIEPAAAYTGIIFTTGDALTGGGELFAPGDAKIEIINDSQSFINIDANGSGLPSLYIPDDLGGIVSLNGVRVSSKEEIDKINQHGLTSDFTAGKILDRQTSDEPEIRVSNTYEDPINLDALNPEIHVSGDVSNLRGLVKLDSTGTIEISSKVFAKTIDIKTKGDFIQTFTVGFTHTGGDPTYNVPNSFTPNQEVWRWVRNSQTGDLEYSLVPYTLDFYYEDIAKAQHPNTSYTAGSGSITDSYFQTLALSSSSSTIAGNNVFISGEKLNINSLIQSGLPEFDLTISTAKAQEAVNANGSWIQLDMMENGELVDPLFQPKIRYLNGQIELQSLSVGGGYMQLYGDIFSTGNGRLKVMDGYGRISIDNQSNYNLAVNRLDTGPGVAGKIKITDTSTKDALGNPLITTISRVDGVVTTTYENMNWNDDRHPLVSNETGRTAEYNPRAGRRLHWFNAERYDMSRWETYDRACFLDCDVIGSITDWLTIDPGSSTGSDINRVVNPRPYGEWLADDFSNRTDTYILDFNRYRTGTTESTISRTGSYYSGLNEHITSRQEWRWNEYNYYDHSLYASVPIQIEFTGSDIGELNVISGVNDLTLNGAVRNLSGATNLLGGNISASELTVIHANDLNLVASGDIGVFDSEDYLSTAIKINLQTSGGLTATATGNIGLWEQDGSLNISQVLAGGVVDLSAEGDLYSNAVGMAITGERIQLMSQNGSIGAGTTIVVDTTSANGNVSAFAARSIELTESAGDLRLGSVESLAGDVTLIANNGSIIDDNSVSIVDVETKAELLDVANRVGLLGADAVASEENTVNGYNLVKQQDYLRYWQMRNVQQGENGNYVSDDYNINYAYQINSADVSDLKSRYGWSDIDVAQYEARQTALYHRAHQEFGASSYSSTFSYDVAVQDDKTYRQLIAGSTWTEGQVTNRIAAGIFKDTADTEVLIEDANVEGYNINLIANAGAIGSESAARIISFADPSSWTDDERLALVAADRNDVSIDYDNQTITVRQKDDVDITLNNTGELQANAAQEIYIGSEEDIRIRQVVSATGADVRIKTGAGLINAATPGTAVVSGKDILLEAGGADLGSEATPFLVNVLGNVTARADGDLFVNNISGDLRIEQVYAGNLAKLVSVGAILENPFNYDLLTDIQAKYISLQAATTIGEEDFTQLKYLDLGSDSNGWVDLAAPDGIYIYSPSRTLNLRNISTDGGFSLTSFASSISVIGSIVTSGDISLSSGEAILFDENGSLTSLDGDVNLLSTGYRLRPITDLFVPADVTQYGIDMAAGSSISSVSGEISLQSSYDAILARLSANSISVSSSASLSLFDAVIASDSVALYADQDLAIMEGANISSMGWVSLMAGLDGSGSIVGNGSDETDIISQGALTLQASDSIGLDSNNRIKAQVGSAVTLSAANINAAISSSSTMNSLGVSVSNIDGGPSSSVNLALESGAGISFNAFNVAVANIDLESPWMSLPQGFLSNYAVFNMPNYAVRVDAASRAPHPDYDVSAFTVTGEFGLQAKENEVAVDALVLRRNPDLRVSSNPPGDVANTVLAELHNLHLADDGDDEEDETISSQATDASSSESQPLVDIDENWFGDLSFVPNNSNNEN